MALNPFFLQGSPNEQRLVQELINEQLRIYGVEVIYIPRKFVRRETILREVSSSKFDDNFALEAYISNYEGYSGQGDILTKFGMSLKDDLSLIISKERYEDFISPLLGSESDEEIVLSSRPREGDLVYFPLGQRLFEVKFVEHEQPFYQLGKLYVYELKCELFEYSSEVIETGITELDANAEEDSLDMLIYQFLLEDNTLFLLEDFSSLILESYLTTTSDSQTDSEDFKNFNTIEDILDFSEVNPFGEII